MLCMSVVISILFFRFLVLLSPLVYVLVPGCLFWVSRLNQRGSFWRCMGTDLLLCVPLFLVGTVLWFYAFSSGPYVFEIVRGAPGLAKGYDPSLNVETSDSVTV